MTDALEKIFRPIVEGQLRSYVADHPEVLAGLRGSKGTKHRAFVASVSKRILGDLLCAQTRMRLAAADVGSATAPGVEMGR